jgi:hypothetical protein
VTGIAMRRLQIELSVAIDDGYPDLNVSGRPSCPIALGDFIETYRDELIRRCQAKVAFRVPLTDKADGRHGVPIFLD